MREIKIAVIDDGVNEKFAFGIELAEDYEISDNGICKRKTKDENKTSHGTICAAILCNNTANYQLYSIKILDEKRKGNKQYLLAALEWCLNNGIDLIHLSIGSSYYGDCIELKNIIDTILAKGIIVVAACDNRNIRTYPACFPGVIGVKTDRLDALKENEYIFIDNPYDGIDIIAFSKFTIHYSNNEKKALTDANSYAAPYITALICNYMSGNEYDIVKIRKYLKNNSFDKNIVNYDYIKRNMLLWQDKIEVPIIAAVYNEEDKADALSLTSRMAASLRKDGYCCIACADDLNAFNLNYVYSIDKYFNDNNVSFILKLRLIYNVELPDILILSISKSGYNDLKKIHSNDGVDIILCINNKKLYGKLRKIDAPCNRAFSVQVKKINFINRTLFKEFSLSEDYDRLYRKIKRLYDKA